MRPRHILLVEDEQFISDLYKRQLEKADFKVDVVTNAGDATVALAQNRYDVILLDIMLPGMNGLQFLQEVKKDSNHSQIPVIILSNLNQESVVKEAFEFGAEGYLVKASYTPDQMVQEVKNILNKQRT